MTKIAKRKILSTPNVTSQLNLPRYMHEFGPLRNLWEGKYLGEGILLLIKEMITQGTHLPWFAKAAMEKFYNERSLECLLSYEGSGKKNDWSEYDSYSDIGTGYGHFVSYKSTEVVRDDIMKGIPVSAISMDEGQTVQFAVGSGKNKKYYNLEVHDSTGKTIFCTWHTWIDVGAPTQIEHKQVAEAFRKKTLDCILLLPDLAKDNISKNEYDQLKYFYHGITKEWRERFYENGTAKYILPRVINVKY